MRRSASTLTTRGLPTQPFFQTQEQRVGLARQQFFEENQRPSGLVSEAVLQSWGRSRSLGHRHHKRPELEPVRSSNLSALLASNRALLDAAQTSLNQLEASLSGTHCRVLLTDASGVVVHTTAGATEPGQAVLGAAARCGVNLSENLVGTTAPGIVVRTGMACAVHGNEHFYELFGAVRCAAAPIRDVRGQLVGVLDLSTESRAFGFDAASLVGVFATSIENRLLQAQSDRLLVLHFQAAPSLLDTPMEGLAGVSEQGQVVWVNATGSSLLGRLAVQPAASVDECLGLRLSDLMDLCGAPQPRLLQMPSGLGIWMRAELKAPGQAGFRHAVAWTSADARRADPMPEPAPEAVASGPVPRMADTAGDSAWPGVSGAPGALLDPAARGTPGQPGSVPPGESAEGAVSRSLAEAQQALIERTLQAHGGNVARAARQLGVSRGLVYRHLKRS